MNEQRAKRKLTAIISADVKGYSRLMADNEEATVVMINTYREVMTGLIKDHRGRVVDAKGDNVLAEFSSVVDAVRCAVQVQKELTDGNSELPEHRRMEFRIGINLGDVIEERGSIYGDGVNVAARLEGLAEGGGICISGTAFDQVKNRISVGYEYQGKRSVKNIPDPVRVYKVLLEPEAAGKVIGEDEPRSRKKRWAAIAAAVVLAVVAGGLFWNFYVRPDVEPASVEKMAYPCPDKPSIAVLPFVNMSGDPEQEYFSDGITEEIITALSKTPKLFVIARTSSFKYKGKEVDVRTVGRELGVKYVLEGSVRKAGDKVRVTSQLIDAQTNNHLWAERYDREMEDFFSIQDAITKKVVTSLQVMLTGGEEARIYSRGTNNLEAYLKLLKGLEQMNRWNNEGNALAQQTIKEVIFLDPNYGNAYYLLAVMHSRDAFSRSASKAQESIVKAMKLAQKAIALDESLAGAYGLLGWLCTLSGQHQMGIAQAEQAIALHPNSETYLWLGLTLNYSGRHEEAVAFFRKALRINPFPVTLVMDLSLATAYRDAERYEEVIPICRKILQQEPDFIYAHALLASSYALMGRLEDARAEASEVLRIAPKFSVNSQSKRMPYKNEAARNRARYSLLKAGLPE